MTFQIVGAVSLSLLIASAAMAIDAPPPLISTPATRAAAAAAATAAPASSGAPATLSPGAAGAVGASNTVGASDLPFTALERARAHIAEGNLDSAIPLLQAFRGYHPESRESLDLLIYCLQARSRASYAAGDLRATVRDLGLAAQYDPTSGPIRRDLATAFTMMGVRLLERGDTEGCMDAFEKAIQMDSSRREIRREYARVVARVGQSYEEGGRILEAISRYRKALDLDSSFVPAHLALGQIYYAREEFEMARHHLRQARTLTTTTIQGLDQLLGRIEREQSATRQYQTVEAEGFVVRFEGDHRPDLFYRVLPILRESRDRAGRIFERTFRQPITVVIYTGESFRRAVDAPDWAAGLYDGKIRLREAELEGAPAYLERIIRHEMGHALIEEMAPGRVPAWIHEGIAKYVEIDRWDPLQDAAYLFQAIRSRTTLPLKSLEPPFARLPRGTDVRLAYAEATAAVRYLGVNYGDHALADLMTLLAAGRSGEAAIDSLTFYNLDAFQKRVEEWVVWEHAR
jgi:tetratricopeptide (TPR) repeat protein